MRDSKGKIVALCLAVGAAWSLPCSWAASQGSIELAEANALVRDYAAHMVERQPPDLKRAWRKQLPGVKLSETGLYALTGAQGRIIFEYLPESKVLHCLSTIHSFRGVVRPWVFRALQEAAAGGVRTNGHELIFEPASKAIFVRETFVGSPVPKEDFIETCDRVMRTGERWRREHFLPALEAFFARHAPPETATARLGDFRATLVLAEDKEAFQDVWDRPPTAREPAVWTLDHTVVGAPVHTFVLFSGCTVDPAGHCRLMATFEILRPDGSSVVSVPAIPLWDGPSPPVGHLQVAGQSLEISFDAEEPLGTYHLRCEVCDGDTKPCVELSLPFELRSE